MRAHVVLTVAAMLFAPTLCPGAFAQVGPPRTVLVIHSGAESFPTNPILDAGIREALESHSELRVDYFAEYLESDLFPEEDASAAFSEYLQGKYHGRRLDVVIAMTDTGLRFALNHRHALFPDVPIVFFGVVPPSEITRRAGAGITGVTVGIAYAETVKLVLALQPSTQRVFVVAAGLGEPPLESVQAEFRDLTRKVKFTYLAEQTVPRLLSAVRAVPRGSVILYIWHSQRDAGNIMYPDEVARLVADASPVPVYGTSDLYLGAGIVGGVMRRTHDTGKRLGEMAVRILTGTRPQDIPIEAAQVVPVVDWRQLQRWRIASSRLPATSQVLFREPSVWERYNVYIVGGLAALLAQAALIAGLLLQRAKRREAERRLRRSQRDLRRSYARVHDLASRLLNAQEGERSWIARELHDDISQRLAALTINLTLLSQTVHGRVKVVVHDAIGYAREIVTCVHDLSHRLRPVRLQLVGLVGALQELQRELSTPGVAVRFTHEHVPQTLPSDVTVCLFRIVQEALHNALKHSRAQTVSVDLRGGPEGLALTIIDDGVGFDVEAAWGRGLGLLSVHERVEAIGGTLEITSAFGAGTRLHIRVPASLRHPLQPSPFDALDADAARQHAMRDAGASHATGPATGPATR